MDYYHKLRFPEDYPKDVLHNIELLNFGYLENITPIGSYAYGMPYAADIDLRQKYFDTGTIDSVTSNFSQIVKDVVYDLVHEKDHFMTDFKIGINQKYKIDIGSLSDGIYYPSDQLKSQIKKYSHNDQRKIIDILNSPQYQYFNGLSSTAYDLINETTRDYYILRWTPSEIEMGMKKTHGTNKSLQHALADKSTIKIDIIAPVKNKFVEFSNNLFLILHGNTGGYVINEDINLQEFDSLPHLNLDLQKEIEKMFYSKVYYNPTKAIKRMFSLARRYEDNLTMNKLYSILDSNIGKLYQIKSDLNTILVILKKVKHVPEKLITNELKSIKNKIKMPEINDCKEIIMKQLDLVIKTKEKTTRIKILDDLIGRLIYILDKLSMGALIQVSLYPIPDNYLPDQKEYVNEDNKAQIIEYPSNIMEYGTPEEKEQLIRKEEGKINLKDIIEEHPEILENIPELADKFLNTKGQIKKGVNWNKILEYWKYLKPFVDLVLEPEEVIPEIEEAIPVEEPIHIEEPIPIEEIPEEPPIVEIPIVEPIPIEEEEEDSFERELREDAKKFIEDAKKIDWFESKGPNLFFPESDESSDSDDDHPGRKKIPIGTALLNKLFEEELEELEEEDQYQERVRQKENIISFENLKPGEKYEKYWEEVEREKPPKKLGDIIENILGIKKEKKKKKPSFSITHYLDKLFEDEKIKYLMENEEEIEEEKYDEAEEFIKKYNEDFLREIEEGKSERNAKEIDKIDKLIKGLEEENLLGYEELKNEDIQYYNNLRDRIQKQQNNNERQKIEGEEKEQIKKIKEVEKEVKKERIKEQKEQERIKKISDKERQKFNKWMIDEEKREKEYEEKWEEEIHQPYIYQGETNEYTFDEMERDRHFLQKLEEDREQYESGLSMLEMVEQERELMRQQKNEENDRIRYLQRLEDEYWLEKRKSDYENYLNEHEDIQISQQEYEENKEKEEKEIINRRREKQEIKRKKEMERNQYGYVKEIIDEEIQREKDEKKKEKYRIREQNRKDFIQRILDREEGERRKRVPGEQIDQQNYEALNEQIDQQNYEALNEQINQQNYEEEVFGEEYRRKLQHQVDRLQSLRERIAYQEAAQEEYENEQEQQRKYEEEYERDYEEQEERMRLLNEQIKYEERMNRLNEEFIDQLEEEENIRQERIREKYEENRIPYNNPIEEELRIANDKFIDELNKGKLKKVDENKLNKIIEEELENIREEEDEVFGEEYIRELQLQIERNHQQSLRDQIERERMAYEEAIQEEYEKEREQQREYEEEYERGYEEALHEEYNKILQEKYKKLEERMDYEEALQEEYDMENQRAHYLEEEYATGYHQEYERQLQLANNQRIQQQLLERNERLKLAERNENVKRDQLMQNLRNKQKQIMEEYQPGEVNLDDLEEIDPFEITPGQYYMTAESVPGVTPMTEEDIERYRHQNFHRELEEEHVLEDIIDEIEEEEEEEGLMDINDIYGEIQREINEESAIQKRNKKAEKEHIEKLKKAREKIQKEKEYEERFSPKKKEIKKINKKEILEKERRKRLHKKLIEEQEQEQEQEEEEEEEIEEEEIKRPQIIKRPIKIPKPKIPEKNAFDRPNFAKTFILDDNNQLAAPNINFIRSGKLTNTGRVALNLIRKTITGSDNYEPLDLDAFNPRLVKLYNTYKYQLKPAKKLISVPVKEK